MGYRKKGKAKLGTSLFTLGCFCVGTLALWGPDWILPAPHLADRAGLQRWLVLREVSELPADTQRALVDRIQQELTPEQIRVAAEPTSPRWQTYLQPRWQRNIERLKRVWFETRATEYCGVAEGERVEFLATQIDFLLAWSETLAAAAGPADPDRGPSAWERFMEDVGQWTREAPTEQRGCYERALRDGVVCWLATSDLAATPPDVRRSLARRVADQLRRPSAERSSAPPLPLSAAQQVQLQRNGWRLAEAWFHHLALEYIQLPRAERTHFVDAQIDNVLHWDLGAYWNSAPAESTGASGPLRLAGAHGTRFGTVLGQLGPGWEEVTQWVSRADPELQPSLDQLLQHVQTRLVLRALPRLPRRQGAAAE